MKWLTFDIAVQALIAKHWCIIENCNINIINVYSEIRKRRERKLEEKKMKKIKQNMDA